MRNCRVAPDRASEAGDVRGGRTGTPARRVARFVVWPTSGAAFMTAPASATPTTPGPRPSAGGNAVSHHSVYPKRTEGPTDSGRDEGSGACQSMHDMDMNYGKR